MTETTDWPRLGLSTRDRVRVAILVYVLSPLALHTCCVAIPTTSHASVPKLLGWSTRALPPNFDGVWIYIPVPCMRLTVKGSRQVQ